MHVMFSIMKVHKVDDCDGIEEINQFCFILFFVLIFNFVIDILTVFFNFCKTEIEIFLFDDSLENFNLAF